MDPMVWPFIHINSYIPAPQGNDRVANSFQDNPARRGKNSAAKKNFGSL